MFFSTLSAYSSVGRLLFASLGLYQTAQASTLARIAVLPQERFAMQNSFLANMLGELSTSDPDFAFELVDYNSEEQIEMCLTQGTCAASLDYSDTDAGFDGTHQFLSDVDSVALPILDDPALVCTLPQYDYAMKSTLMVAAFWVVGVYAFFVIFALFVSRLTKLEKPFRADARTTSAIIDQDGVELFE